MGVEITAYSHVRPVACQNPEECSHATAFIHPAFPGRNDSILAGCYAYHESISIAGMSYGAYNRWREWLSSLNNHTPKEIWDCRRGNRRRQQWARQTPFYELIDFADNEGTLGPEVCAKLAVDFKNSPGLPGVARNGYGRSMVHLRGPLLRLPITGLSDSINERGEGGGYVKSLLRERAERMARRLEVEETCHAQCESVFCEHWLEGASTIIVSELEKDANRSILNLAGKYADAPFFEGLEKKVITVQAWGLVENGELILSTIGDEPHGGARVPLTITYEVPEK